MITPCKKVKEGCKHSCCGVAHETRCLPCLDPECIEEGKVSKDDLCNICFTSELSTDPAVKLGCGHIFHAQCVRDLFTHKWSSLRISFDFLSCPACKTPIRNLSHVPQLQTDLSQLLKFKKQIETLCEKVKAKGKISMSPVTKAGGQFFNKPKEYLLAKCAFYQCKECSKPFYGGLADCERDLQMNETQSKDDLICKKCAIKQIGAGQYNCEKHGHKFITWKCYACCSEALYLCGSMYLCEDHHNGHLNGTYKQNEIMDCGGVDCPLGVPHPTASKDPIKSMYPLGCSLCRVKTYGVAPVSEEVNLDDFKPKLDLSQAANYRCYNPLYDKVQAVKKGSQADLDEKKRLRL